MKEDGDVEQEALHVWPLVIGTTDWSKGRMIQESKEVWKCHTGLKSSESVYLHGKTSEGQLPLREWSSSYNSSKGPRVSVPKYVTEGPAVLHMLARQSMRYVLHASRTPLNSSMPEGILGGDTWAKWQHNSVSDAFRRTIFICHFTQVRTTGHYTVRYTYFVMVVRGRSRGLLLVLHASSAMDCCNITTLVQ